MSKKAETIGLTRLHAIAKGIDERADGFNDGWWETDRDAARGRQTLEDLENLVMTLEEERDAAKAESVANALACGKQDSAFKAAMREGWEMADPLHPLGAPGSYFRGEHNGITAALHTVQQAYDRQAAASADQTLETRNQADDFYESVVQQYNDLSRARLQTAEIGEIISTSDNVAPPSKPTDEALHTAWRTAGGEFHGPHIETGTMPKAKLLPFLRSLTAPAAAGPVAVPDGYALISTDALQAWGKLELVKAACVYPRAATPAAPADMRAAAFQQHHRDSAELHRLCGERDQARKEKRLQAVEITALESTVRHLSRLVDHQSTIAMQAVAAMKVVQDATNPVDESNGDLDARVPYDIYEAFVDERVALAEALSESPAAAPADALDASDTALLDHLDHQGFAYGFQDLHEGNRWEIEGPFRTVRDALRAAIAAQAAQKPAPT